MKRVINLIGPIDEFIVQSWNAWFFQFCFIVLFYQLLRKIVIYKYYDTLKLCGDNVGTFEFKFMIWVSVFSCLIYFYDYSIMT